MPKRLRSIQVPSYYLKELFLEPRGRFFFRAHGIDFRARGIEFRAHMVEFRPCGAERFSCGAAAFAPRPLLLILRYF